MKEREGTSIKDGGNCLLLDGPSTEVLADLKNASRKMLLVRDRADLCVIWYEVGCSLRSGEILLWINSRFICIRPCLLLIMVMSANGVAQF